MVDVTSESKVMDVRTPRKDLSILFQGQDIQKENPNLRILGVRLVNECDTNILESYFDSRIPWRLRVDGGRLIEARVTRSNSQYSLDNRDPRVSGRNANSLSGLNRQNRRSHLKRRGRIKRSSFSQQ